MSSINDQIDAAVSLMKARAATFDDNPGVLPMGEWVARDGMDAVVRNLLGRAHKNLGNARTDWGTLPMRYLVRQDLCDVMNLCALALSVLPVEAGQE